MTYLFALDIADLSRAGIGDGDHFDQFGIIDALGLGGSEGCLQVHTPVGAEPHQALQRDDGAAPHEGPFLRGDVLLVQLGRQVIARKDGPEGDERPDVEMKIPGERRKELGALDLAIVDKRSHGEA